MLVPKEVSMNEGSLDSEESPKVVCYGYGTSQYRLAYEDIKEGILKWRIWFMLAYQDIRLRYRRSVIGPFWITLSMAITVYSMGFLYARIFHQDLSSYFPFLITGMLSWTVVSTIVTELTDGLVNAEGLVKQIKLPYTIYMHRIATRNFLIFFHNLLVMLPIYFIYPSAAKVNLNMLLIFLGLLLVYINTIFYGLVVSMIGSRFRDISQVMKSLMQIVFFITPIMWRPEVLGEKGQFFANLNPIYALLQMVREPMLGEVPTMANFAISLGITIAGVLISGVFFSKYRSRIVYWL